VTKVCWIREQHKGMTQMKDMPKAQFSALMAIIQAHSWVSSKAGILTELMLDDCTTPDEQTLIADLISRFKYVPAKDFVDKINDLVSKIVALPNLAPNETIIAAMASDSGPDSSQALVQNIKIKLQKAGWGDVLIVNAFNQVYKKSKESGFSRKNVILVDEFIGSGRTVIGRVAELKRTFNNNGQDINIFVNVIFSSIVGITAIQDKQISLSYVESIGRGISDFEHADVIDLKINSMLNIEEKLSKEYGSHSLLECSLGYGKTESLIGIEDCNIPNNVFPVFWWGQYLDGKRRNTLFSRYVGAS
jgi:hypothetical protein